MAELDRTTLKSEIVAELVAYLSLHPEVFDVLEHAPWQTSRIRKVERAVCELKEWRSRVEAHAPVGTRSEIMTVGMPPAPFRCHPLPPQWSITATARCAS